MENPGPFEPSVLDDLMNATALCANMNIGLLVYHAENFQQVASLKLIYANEEASKYTGTDLAKLVGKTLPQAFPELIKTDVPEMFLEVARTGNASKIGVMEYSDENVKQGYFEVKAFPLPSDCIGVAFENATHRKQLEKMIKNYTDKLRSKNQQLEKLASTIYNEVILPLQKIQTGTHELKGRIGNVLPAKDVKFIDEIDRSTTQPIAGPWLSPNVVTVNNRP